MQVIQLVDKRSRENGETNDCVVKSLSILTGYNYDQCHNVLRRCGRKFACGTYRDVTNKAIVILGYNYTIVYDTKARPVMSLRHARYKYPVGLYLVFTNHHALPMVDGCIIDNYTKNGTGRHKVKTIYQLNRVSDCLLTDSELNVPVVIEKTRKQESINWLLVHKETNEVFYRYKRKPRRNPSSLFIPGRKEETLGNLILVKGESIK